MLRANRTYRGDLSAMSGVEVLETRRLLAAAPMVDIVFLDDNTGSTSGAAMTAFQNDSKGLLARIDAFIGKLDRQYGVAAYRDFDDPGLTDPFVYRINTSLQSGTTAANAGISTWFSDGGGDYPEANLFALTHSTTDFAWRPGAFHFIVWMGDAPGHDPSPSPGLGSAGDIVATLPSTITALTSKSIHVIGISFDQYGGGLDDNSVDGHHQATEITTATNGVYVSKQIYGDAVIDVAYNKIIGLISSMVFQASDDSIVLNGMPFADVNVLANDWGSGMGLHVASHTQPAHGLLTQNYDGSWRYTPTDGYSGKDSFTYVAAINDGTTQTANVDIQVNVPVTQNIVVNGTTGNDKINVSASGDTIAVVTTLPTVPVTGTTQLFSRIGAKTITINGMGGNDVITVSSLVTKPCIINTGDGNVSVVGGSGNDTISGGKGNDTIDGGAGDDVIFVGDGASYVMGGPGNDAIYGGLGNDTMDGGIGDDSLVGGVGNSVIFGGDGNDTIHGGTANNTIFGGNGNDVIYGGSHTNAIYTGNGNSTVFAKGNTGFVDFIYGGSGDTIAADPWDIVRIRPKKLLA